MARKIENDDFLDDSGTMPDASQNTNAEPADDAPVKKNGKKEKRKVVVINVPKKKKPIRTPSHIIRITLIWCMVIELFLLTYPFMQVKFYITKNLEVTPYADQAYNVLASQEEIDSATDGLQAALDSLVEAPKEESSSETTDKDSKTENSSSDKTDESKASGTDKTSAAESSSTGTALDNTGYRAIETVSSDWTYALRTDVNAEKLEKLLDDAKKIQRQKYTDESLEKLNHAILVAQKTLCASVFVSQNGLQMMLGGTIGEAYGATLSVGNTIVRGLLTFSLSILPLAAIIALAFDKKKAVKNVIVLICSILAIVDIYFTIYPFIGIGAVLAIILYIIAIIINLGGFYAYRQEKFIIAHPELEAEFTQQHPHLVKALINEKSFGDVEWMDRKSKERAAAQQAKKKMQKKKRSK